LKLKIQDLLKFMDHLAVKKITPEHLQENPIDYIYSIVQHSPPEAINQNLWLFSCHLFNWFWKHPKIVQPEAINQNLWPFQLSFI